MVSPRRPCSIPGMTTSHVRSEARLLDERDPEGFRQLFGEIISGSTAVETAILRIRLSGVDLSEQEVTRIRSLRVLVAEVNARTVEEEAYALLQDSSKRQNLHRILALLRNGRLEIRSSPLGGWSPDFTVFSNESGPVAVLLGLHLFRRPFPYKGPTWAARFGPEEARRAHRRFEDLWEGAHEIGQAVRGIMERATRLRGEGEAGSGSLPARETPGGQEERTAAGPERPVDTPSPPG